MEEVFLAKGWKPPTKKRSNPDVASGYKVKKKKKQAQ
jgi:hypothetical protein